MSLEELWRSYEIDPDFLELRSNAQRIVPGIGPTKAPEVCFIGEAPGRNEDAGGEPFIGRSGKVLDKALKSIDLARKDVYITNVVKYRPTDGAGRNRPPRPAEVKASIPYLRRELFLVRPKVIVTLGAFAFRALCPTSKESIGVVHGQRFFTRAGTPLVVLHHPATILYGSVSLNLYLLDFKTVSRAIREAHETAVWLTTDGVGL